MNRDTPANKPLNRLGGETSPYLLQHAHNPVAWQPWDAEALGHARDRDCPIFLSIGYSACHWCHVMEHESFEDEGIAGFLNKNFVNIKVDREERPDLDQLYMNSVVAISGRGGWPMSVFLTPDLRPFFGGTYWPPAARMGMPGFRDVIDRVRAAWDQRRADVFSGAGELTDAVKRMCRPPSGQVELNDTLLHNAGRELLRAFDPRFGGFGQAPKFPHPMDLRVLLRVWNRFGNAEALDAVRITCDRMANGGIYDQLGGGFHRYSTDERWLVPHFEKMLYDNALLTSAYLEAFQAMGDPNYARVVRETLDYVIREMAQPGGGFYSTQDADSEGEEGRFFVWTEREIDELLDPVESRLFVYCYDVTSAGNWEGHNILNRVKPHDEAALMLGVDPDELAGVLARCRRKLFQARTGRVAPGRDEKVLASWNGLMISAMAQAAGVLHESNYAAVAATAADFVLERMRHEDGSLLHAYKDQRARFNAFLDDYACLIDGLAELYQTTFQGRYLSAALELAADMVSRFHDSEAGGFFYTSHDHEQLIARNTDSQDNATPSGNAMAATALLKLGRLCARSDFEELAEATLRMISGQLERAPMSGGQSLIALDFLLGPTREIVLVDGRDPGEGDRMLHAVCDTFVPNKVLIRSHSGDEPENREPVAALLAGRECVDERLIVWVCERGSCRLPVTSVGDLPAELGVRNA